LAPTDSLWSQPVYRERRGISTAWRGKIPPAPARGRPRYIGPSDRPVPGQASAGSPTGEAPSDSRHHRFRGGGDCRPSGATTNLRTMNRLRANHMIREHGSHLSYCRLPPVLDGGPTLR
jgi:hypothetical protein